MNTSKYQPHTIAQIVFANDESRQLIEDIVTGVMPFPFEGKTGILLYGTFGSGKTTLARLLPEAIEQGQTAQSLAMPYEFFGCQQGHVGTAFTAMVENTPAKHRSMPAAIITLSLTKLTASAKQRKRV